MREIIFRGKRVDNGEWVEGYYAKLTVCVDNSSEERDFIIPHDIPVSYSDRASCCFVISETVGQYTGLRDCKRTKEYPEGQKIFEGDIVKTYKFNTPNKRYVIKYDLLLGAFIGEDNGTMYFTTFDGDSELFEIIGTIHDNPELIGGEENA